jgi:hypothetical protein
MSFPESWEASRSFGKLSKKASRKASRKASLWGFLAGWLGSFSSLKEKGLTQTPQFPAPWRGEIREALTKTPPRGALENDACVRTRNQGNYMLLTVLSGEKR